jgi:inositol 1,4,5-triphosphate receptor type 1/inositol 1,4,5-triphosphate receptor type 3
MDNESYVYNLFARIQYQVTLILIFNFMCLKAKYLKCATDCIISIISDNEDILNNIADSIKINKDASEDQKKEIENNLIYYFLRIAEDQTGNKKLKNCDFLRFFRSICKYQGKGMSGNQEILHELLLDPNQALKKSIFLPIKM